MSREWKEINTQIGERRKEVLDIIYKKDSAEHMIFMGAVIIGMGVAMSTSREDASFASKVAMVEGGAFVLKFGLDCIFVIPRKIQKLTGEIEITKEEMENWYLQNHDDFSF